jgi:oxygen tolerance protein BatD
MLLAALLLVQGSAPDITASVDRTRIVLGEQVTLTVEVRVSGSASPRLELPSLDGFSVLGSRDAAAVSLQGADGLTRTAVRALTLEAERPGRLVIGPVRVRVGDRSAATEPLTIVVDSAAFPAATFGAATRALLAAAAPPPHGDQVSLSIVLPQRQARIGQQLDLLLAAWFPRDVRARLRRAPQLTLQTPEAVWALPPATPDDVVLSRQVGGRWMDLYAVHQVLFPLSAGRIVVPPGSMTYAVPLSFSFFSTEERYSVTTDSAPITVLPLPVEGRPRDDQGVVAAGLHVDIEATAEARVGEPVELAITLSGTGNPSLWPPPALHLPPAFRSYSGEATTRISSLNGRVGGVKTFRYMLVPDSAGAFLLPAVRYPYFDSDAGEYRVIEVGARSIVAAPGVDPQAARPLPPLLAPSSGGRPWADQVAGALGLAGWLAIALLPPVVAVWRTRRRAPPAAPAAPPVEGTRLGGLEREFLRRLTAHVADAATREGEGLARALQAAGVERSIAARVVRVRDRLRAARYGPRGSEDLKSLPSELEQVLRALEPERRAGRRSQASGLRASLALLGLLAAGAPGRAQGPVDGTSAEALYQAGAMRAATDSFAARAAADTLNPAHWYDLGAALYGSGADGKAVAAWVTAQRLAPRNAVIRQARTLLPPPDAITEQLLTVGLVTPGECGLAAAACWIACWGVLLVLRRRVVAAVFGGLALVAVAFGQVERQRRARPVGVIVGRATPVRAAPYGSASASIVLEPGVAVLVEDAFNAGQWLRVRRPDGVNGWIQAGQLARL